VEVVSARLGSGELGRLGRGPGRGLSDGSRHFQLLVVLGISSFDSFELFWGSNCGWGGKKYEMRLISNIFIDDIVVVQVEKNNAVVFEQVAVQYLGQRRSELLKHLGPFWLFENWRCS
jgi:hypothetical protein